MKFRSFLTALAAIATAAVLAPPAHGQGQADPAAVAREVAAATAGQTVELPAGAFAMTIDLPPGVSLKGAGYGKTVIDARGNTYGIKAGGSGVAISDLAVRGASTTDILIDKARYLNIRRVRVSETMIGIDIKDSSGSKVENCIADRNRYGFLLTGGSTNSVINCTAADNTNMGFSFPSGDGIVAFNNLSSGSSVAVNIGDSAHNVTLDYNLLLGVCIGKAPGRSAPRQTMNDWHFVSGLDAHSVSIPVKYADPASGNYSVTNTLDWWPNRIASADWGATALDGIDAPKRDIEGSPRSSQPSVGAFEAQPVAARPADGLFTVPGGPGVTSAGIFDHSGKLISYLFQEMPLAPGEYPYWLPARTSVGEPISAGRYELRVVKGNLKWRSLGWFGNTMNQGQDNLGAPAGTGGIAFDGNGHIIAGNTPSDTFSNIREADAANGKWNWAFWGTERMPGPALTVARDGLLYIMRNMPGQGMCVARLHTDTGSMVMDNSVGGEILLGDAAAGYTGMSALGDRLCYTDTDGNAVRFGTADSPVPSSSVSVPAPSCPAADAKTGVVWVISNGKVIGVSPTSQDTYTIDVPTPIQIAARDGVLAAASGSTGKITIYDVSKPSSPNLIRTLGRGDGPDGLILPERFLFQNNPYASVRLAIGPDQALAVSDGWRLEVFNRDDTLRWTTWGHWGGGDVASSVHPGRVYDDWGYSYLADGVTGTWKPESYHRAMVGMVAGDCKIAGKTFAFFESFGGAHGWSDMLVEFSPDKARQVLTFETQGQSGTLNMRRDTNGDGMINSDDIAAPVLDAQGKPLPPQTWVHHIYNNILADGTIVTAQYKTWMSLWKCAGLDSSGVPIYRVADRVMINGIDKLVSPYSWKTGDLGVGQIEPRPGGGWYVCANLESSPRYGKSPFNNGGTDMIGIDKTGAVDWVQTFAQFSHIGASPVSNGLCVVGDAETEELQIINRDGLELPGFSADAPLLDHTQAVESFVDRDGKINIMVTDCTRSCYHWYRLDSCDIRSSTTQIDVGAAQSSTLAALPASPPTFTNGQPPAITFTVSHLKAPLSIDGDLQKWRDAGITPQIILTPDIGGVNITGGAKDCSVIARLAWADDDLYFQAFKFDNVVVTDLPTSRAYLGDTIEMPINGAIQGMKLNFSITSDHGSTIYADGGYPFSSKLLSDVDAPRVFKVLDNAQSVTERSLLESITGLDMADCKVEYFEAKIPIDKSTYEGKENSLWNLKSGNTFWVAFQIDDNDVPGSDSLRLLSWPLGYGYYYPPENDAKAVLE